jgi:hypothetical protein
LVYRKSTPLNSTVKERLKLSNLNFEMKDENNQQAVQAVLKFKIIDKLRKLKKWS